jgi:5-(carboxyamino)imidazole ribonucleotide mutase
MNLKLIKKVAIVMGSKSDLETMQHTADILKKLEIEYDIKVVSAHRTPERLYNFAKSAYENYCCIIAGAGGAAHLPGMIASMSWLPVFGVPVNATSLNGMDSLLSIVQMPGGIPVSTMSIGISGAKNAGLSAAALISLYDEKIRENLINFRKNQSENVKEEIES